MAKFMGIKVSIVWEYIQVWKSVATQEYRLQTGVEPGQYGLEALSDCVNAHEMLNLMGSMGWELFQILPEEESRVYNYFFKRPIIQEAGQPLQQNNTGPDSVSKDFDIIKRLMGEG